MNDAPFLAGHSTEYGHLIEAYMMNKDDVDKYKKHLTEGLTIKDIKVAKAYDSAGNEHEIFVLKGKKFESRYQTRLYVDNIFDAINPDGSINIDVMGECISEPFRKYMNNEKISDEVKELIERAIL